MIPAPMDGMGTPWKINMEPKNRPFRKENDLPNLQGIMFHVNLPGCNPVTLRNRRVFSSFYFREARRFHRLEAAACLLGSDAGHSSVKFKSCSSWWLNQPHLKNMLVKLDHETPNRDENKIYLKPQLQPSVSGSIQ